MCGTIVMSRSIKYGRSRGVKKIVEIAGESDISTKPDTDSGETKPDDGTGAEEIIKEELIHHLEEDIERLKEQ
jgi:hypothetical protein